jgi:hypothetical protein
MNYPVQLRRLDAKADQQVSGNFRSLACGEGDKQQAKRGGIMRYQVIIGKTADEFTNAVNKAIAEGWRLQGGVAVIHLGDRMGIYQAMVRDE